MNTKFWFGSIRKACDIDLTSIISQKFSCKAKGCKFIEMET